MATKYAGQNALNKLMQLMKTALGNKADKTNATTSADGLMSAADKLKLDTIEQGAKNVDVDDTLSTTSQAAIMNKTVTAALDGKLDKSGGTLTGDLTISGAWLNVESTDTGDANISVDGSLVAGRGVSVLNGDKSVSLVCTGDNAAKIAGSGSNYARLAVGTPDGDNDAATKAYVDSKVAAGGVTVDDSVSSTSTNPVQNKAIKAELDKKLDKSGGTVTGFLRVNDSVYAEGHISTGLNISAKMLQLNAEGSTDDNPVLVDIAPNADDASALDVLATGGGATKYGSIIVATPTDAQTNYAATVEYVKNKVAGLQTADQVQTAINSAISGVYTPKGSIAFKSLPTAAAGNKGWVYNVTDAFTTTSAFVEGTGHTYAAGTNVVCVDAGSGSYKWDVLAGTIDLTELTATEVQTLWDSI